VGSYGFYKAYGRIAGSTRDIDYALNVSGATGKGYRVHQGFFNNTVYEKLAFHPSDKISIRQIISLTDYFQQNPEGLNLSQFNDLRQANPDAVPFNEYQKTVRTTVGMVAKLLTGKSSALTMTGYFRPWKYKETSNKAAEYRNIINYGSIVQYDMAFGGKIKHNLAIGGEFKRQNVNLYRLQSAPIPGRTDRLDELNIETDSLLTNNFMRQQSMSPYAVYSLSVQNLTLLVSARYDMIDNLLFNRMAVLDSAFSRKDFRHLNYKAGLSYEFNGFLTAYAGVSNAFIPPSTEELANNPFGYGGFNTHLIPATSFSYEAGLRGNLPGKGYFELTGFVMQTQNDFFRFKLSQRGNQEVFYGNAGNSLRKGLETYVRYRPVRMAEFVVSYTFSDFRYVSSATDSFYLDTAFVLTKPPAPGQYLPNSPKHVLNMQISLQPLQDLWITLEGIYRSPWAIYTDADAYAGLLDPAVFRPWYEGYKLLNINVSYDFSWHNAQWHLVAGIENVFDTPYIAFTEPDPDGNSYHPGPGRQVFFGVRVSK